MPQILVGWIGRSALVATCALGPGLAIAQASPEAAAAPSATAAAPAAAPATPPSSAPPHLPYEDGKIANGATKAAVCSACHGQIDNPDWPRLAGQSAIYIAEQLHLFRSGARPNPVMMPQASLLSDQDIDDLAVYFEAQTPAGLEADPSYWQAGQALYVRGDSARAVPGCIACHGPVGGGNLTAGVPALRAQQSVYAMKQLNDYASGKRYTGAKPPQASRNGAVMVAIAKRLTSEEIRDVASYLQGMR